MEKANKIVQYEDVKARNPLTGEITTVKIEKVEQKTPEEQTGHVKAELQKYGLEPVSTVEVTDPFSGEKKLITLDRTGQTEEKLIIALANPDLSRDQKDFALSMYAYERGKESMSFVMDIMRYKGMHTKETKVFKSQMRFDFEQFVNAFCTYLEEQVIFAGEILGKDIKQEQAEFEKFVQERNELDKKEGAKEKKKYTYLDFAMYADKRNDEPNALVRMYALQVSNAIHSLETATRLRKLVRSIADARQREKGKGIYIDRSGKPYLEDDPELDAIIAADRKAREEAMENE